MQDAMTTLSVNHNFRRHILYYYNRFAPLYDLGEFVRRGTRQKAMSLSGWQPGERVLDLCTGTGELALTFAAQGAPVIGVDIARGMLKRASAKSAGRDSTWLEMDATHLAFPDKSFEVSMLSLALHHMPEKVQLQVLSELCRVTRRRAVIVEPDVPVKPNWVPAWKFVASVIDESEYMHEWAEQDFLGTCQVSGLNVEAVIESTFWLHRILLCSPKH
jgi:demethylmenaquinone methyltransferase/2-methoxy-6-polyprenyl-1,4-benzoquinol methylase